MRVRLLVILAAILLSLGSANPPTYRVRRSALVPHPAPPDWSGQPMRKTVEVRARSSTEVVPVKPTEEPGANAGLYVARHNVGASIRGRPSENWSLGLAADLGLATDAMQIADDSTKPPHEGPSRSWQANARYSIPLDGGWRLGLGGSAGVLRAPVRETGECIANCDGVAQFYEKSGTKAVGVVSGSAVVSYRRDAITVFGGVTVQNHPRNTKNGTLTLGTDDSEDDLSSGPAYTLVGGGLEWQATDDVKLMAQLYQPVSTEIAHYGPVAGFSVAFDLGQRAPQPRDTSADVVPPMIRDTDRDQVHLSVHQLRERRARCAQHIAHWRRATTANDRVRIYNALPSECRPLVDATDSP